MNLLYRYRLLPLKVPKRAAAVHFFFYPEMKEQFESSNIRASIYIFFFPAREALKPMGLDRRWSRVIYIRAPLREQQHSQSGVVQGAPTIVERAERSLQVLYQVSHARVGWTYWNISSICKLISRVNGRSKSCRMRVQRWHSSFRDSC